MPTVLGITTQVEPASHAGAHAPNSFPTPFGPGGGVPLHPTVVAGCSVAHGSPPSVVVEPPVLVAPPVLPALPPPDRPPVLVEPPVDDELPPVDVEPSLTFELLELTAVSEPHATTVETQRARPAPNRRKFMVANHM